MPTVVFRAGKEDLEENPEALFLNSDIVENPPKENGAYAPISVCGYIGLILLSCIPIINLVFLIICASGGAKKITVKNYSKAVLIIYFLFAVILMTLWIAFGNFWSTLLNSTIF